MKKRALALAITILILVGMCGAVPVAALDAPLAVAEDFVAGEITGNLITTYPTAGNLDINTGEVRAVASGSTAVLSAVSDCNGSSDWGLQGFEINSKFIYSLTDNNYAPAFTQGTKVLFAGKVRKASDATTNARINVAYTSAGYGKQYYPDNYSSQVAGKDITDTEWSDFKATITAPENMGGQYWRLVFGFSKGVAAGAKAELDMSSLYFGTEYVHDIKITVDGATNVEAGAGTVINADADILNQIGDKYSTQGTFDWYALDETRTQIIPGIVITPGADGTAVVRVGASVSAGNYVIVAQSAEFEEMVRSFTVTVGVKDWSDHTPEIISNIINTHPTEGNLDINDANVSANASGNIATLSAKTTVEPNVEHALQGIVINDKFISDWSEDNAKIAFESDAKILFSAKVRKKAGATENATINIAYSIPGNGNSAAWHYPDNYTDGFEVTDTEWMDFEAVITARENIGGASYWQLLLGFYGGMTQGSDVEIDMSSMYFAPYKASDIKITDNTGTATLDPGVPASFTAAVIDESGKAMGDDESFIWALINEEKNARISGVTFTPDDADPTTVYVVADKTVVPGNYYLVAESASGETQGWIKSILVTVLKPTINDYVAGTIPGAIDDIILTRTDSGSHTMGVVDTAVFSASIVDSNDMPVLGEQDFVWFVMNETRKENVTSEFTVISSDDTRVATVTPKLTTANGTYYVMAQYAYNEEIVKGIKIVIDKAQSVENGANLLNNGSATDINAQISELAEIVEVCAELKAAMAESTGAVKLKTSEILASSFGGDNQLVANTMADVTDAIEKAIIFALYEVNPQSVVLYGADGKFAYSDEMGLSDIDKNGITLYEAFNTVLSDEGRNAMQTELKSGSVTTIESFTDTIKEYVVLYGVAYPDEIGVSYLEKILTEKNLTAVGINAPKYLARADKSETHKKIARNFYTKEALEAVLEAEQGGSAGGNNISGGASGGGGGGGYSAPIETTPKNETVDKETVSSEYPKFTDVSENHWAYSDIYYLRERNIINGIDEKTFNPNGNITREQFAKILCATFDIKATTGKTEFKDVDEKAWYASFVSAVFDKGIVTGISSENFGVGQYITRQDLCTMISRAVNNEKYTYTTLGFKDDDKIAEYAKGAVALLKGLGIVNGYEDGSFNPQGLCTRAEAAKIICKLLAEMEVLSK